MKKAGFLLIFSIFICELSLAEGTIVTTNDESKKFQNSAFIKLMTKLNDGKIPYPFSSLLDSFRMGVREDGHVLLVPKGRSLVKEYANYHNPRIIVAPINKRFQTEILDEEKKNQWNLQRLKIEEMGISGADLYIGFAPEHKALEVISYNPEKPGYDFFIIEDYEEGKTPKIVHNPALCISCHQNEAPIFSKLPWGELVGESTANIIGEKKLDPNNINRNGMLDLIIKANPERSEIHGIPININPTDTTQRQSHEKSRFDITDVAEFDLLIRRSNKTVFINKSCEALCPKADTVCQETIILEALKDEPNYKRHKFFKDIDKKVKSINLKSSVIPSRNPENNAGQMQLITEEELVKRTNSKHSDIANFRTIEREQLHLAYDISKTYDTTYHETFASGTDFIEKINDNIFIDPTTTRPTNSDVLELQKRVMNATDLNKKISLVVAQCSPLQEIQNLSNKNSIDLNFLQRKSISDALKNWPDTKMLIRTIKKELEIKTELVNDQVNCNPKIVPIVPVYQYQNIEKSIIKLKNETIDRPVALLEKYCTQCHGPNGFIKLPLDSLESMANYKPTFGAMIGPLNRLKEYKMPPEGVPQPTLEERNDMIKAIEEVTSKP